MVDAMLENVSDKMRLKNLKDFVMKRLPSNSSLRTLILSEPDELPKEEIAIKVRIWFILLRKELAQQPSGRAAW